MALQASLTGTYRNPVRGEYAVEFQLFRNLLVVPAQLSSVRIQGDDAGGVQIHILTLIASGLSRQPLRVVEIRRGVACAPIEHVQVRIVGARQPRRAATEFPAIALPGLIAFLTRTRDHVPAPRQPARLDVEGG